MAGREDPARDRIVEEHLGLVRTIARRYARGRDEPLEDLVQVGAIGLLKAVDRFDARRGSDLRAIAAPFIEGEIRHHLRDHSGVLRGAPDRVLPLGDGDRDGPTAAPDRSDERALVTAGLDFLDGRERRIIELRYFEDRRQADIAAELGISQTQVSRLIQRALARMREGLGEAGPATPRSTNGRRAPGSRSGRVLVRMEPALHRRLAETAEAQERSLNALITATLERAVAPPARDAPPPRPTKLLIANLAAIAIAIAIGVVLLVLALERGW